MHRSRFLKISTALALAALLAACGTRPAAVKLSVCATCTNTERLPKLSMIPPLAITDTSVR